MHREPIVGKGLDVPRLSARPYPSSRPALGACDLALEVREVAADFGQREGSQDRFLRLAQEEELEAALDEPLRRPAAGCQSLEVGARERDGVPGLTPAVADRDLAEPTVGGGHAADVDVGHLVD